MSYMRSMFEPTTLSEEDAARFKQLKKTHEELMTKSQAYSEKCRSWRILLFPFYYFQWRKNNRMGKEVLYEMIKILNHDPHLKSIIGQINSRVIKGPL